MKRFNLVPDSTNAAPQRRQISFGNRDMDLVIIALPIILSIAVVFFMHMSRTEWQAKIDPVLLKKYNALKKETSISSIIGSIKDGALLAGSERNKLKTNLDRLKGLNESKKVPVNLLISISNNISERVALTLINKKEQIVSMEGIAQDNESLSDFIDTLLKGGIFKTVNLKLTKYSDDYGPYKQVFVVEGVL